MLKFNKYQAVEFDRNLVKFIKLYSLRATFLADTAVDIQNRASSEDSFAKALKDIKYAKHAAKLLTSNMFKNKNEEMLKKNMRRPLNWVMDIDNAIKDITAIKYHAINRHRHSKNESRRNIKKDQINSIHANLYNMHVAIFELIQL